MVIKCYQSGHILLKLELKNVPGGVDRVDEKLNYLKTSQQNKFKNAMVAEFNKHRYNLEVLYVYIFYLA